MNPNDYEKQQVRAWSRKRELVELMGGKCCKCGYNNNYAALEFHHVDPQNKAFQLDSRHLSNTSMNKILDEVRKCILVCSNCHKEIHYPNSSKSAVETVDAGSVRSIINRKEQMSVCPVCGATFKKARGKIFCSKECRNKSKGYPTKEDVEMVYRELKSQEKTAKHFGLTRKIIINILKN